jgi:hopanoid biosynthesis associated protein HpnK
MAQSTARSVVIVADDFGKSPSINQAIEEAHQSGIVNAASIMPGGKAFADAVRVARRNPDLSVGLHVTLCDGAAVLSPAAIPGLVDQEGTFSPSPARAWIRYSRQALMPQIRRELSAQFDLAEKSGIRLTHIDGHHHMHMHPAVFSLVIRQAALRGIRWVRLPREPFSLALRMSGRGPRPIAEWVFFRMVGRSRRRSLVRGLKTADTVCGLSGTGRLDSDYLLQCANGQDRLIEIFAHPDTATPQGRRELAALCDPRVRESMELHGIRIAGYEGLDDNRDRAGEAA